MIKSRYKIRYGSIAWYCHKFWKPITILICIITIALSMYNTTAFPKMVETNINRETEIKVNATTTETETDKETVIKTQKRKWNIPLNTELQNYIISTCKEYNISPELVVAVIQRESNYNANTIGDNGNSFGLMQIQPQWHSKRMERLNCNDLLNPFENVTVGIDILAEMLNKYDTTEKALTAYNAGDTGAYNLYFSKGINANEYALDVINIMHTLE